MKIKCIHGYFIFEETAPGQLSDFMNTFEVEIDTAGDHFTFADLIDAPDYSFLGGLFLTCPTIKTFAGRPWDVMRENKIVYNFSLGLVVPMATIVTVAQIREAQTYFVTNGLLMPGSLTDEGLRVTDYSAHYDADMKTFRYSEVTLDAII